MTKQPEQKQIKEFWEWCGQYKTCGYCEGTGRIYSSPNSYSQCGVCEGRGCFHPDLDLNNLFKYAVPKCAEIYVNIGDGITNAGAKKLTWSTTRDADPALALFWAIYSVIAKSPHGR